jgi:FkbM family methyltransferase
MNTLIETLSRTRNIIPLKVRMLLFIVCSKILNISFMQAYYRIRGIDNFQNDHVSGEAFLREKLLTKYFNERLIEEPVIFDAGANIGRYSTALKKCIPACKLYAFEPNPYAFEKLNEQGNRTGFKCFCTGLSDNPAKSQLYFDKNEKHTELATLEKNVLTDVFGREAGSCEIHLTTLDTFCNEHSIKRIHFLKIDTEGHEFRVLKGAQNLLQNNLIDIIQFEFNDMNIYSKVFLKDFFELMNNYKLFRLDTRRLIDISKYNTELEIFRYQNIVAVNRDLNL